MDIILQLDVSTLMQVLIWGNLAFLMLSFTFVKGMVSEDDREVLVRFFYAKLSMSIGWTLLIMRDSIPDILTVNLGNTFIFTGFYLESYVILSLLGKGRVDTKRILFWITCGILLAFNGLSYFGRFSTGIRIGYASVFVILLWLPSALTLMLGRNRTFFDRFLGVVQLLLAIIFLPRAYMGFSDGNMGLLSNNTVQSLSFLTLVMNMLINSSGFLLMVYQDANNRLKDVAKIDPLTKIRNRRAFIEVSEPLYNFCQRNKEPVTVLFIDLDHFKRVNDTYGHAMGDLVLVETAALMETSLRGSDILCRYGGEEFVVLLPNTTQETGMVVAERIRSRVADALYTDGVQELTITVSIGLYSGTPKDDEKLLKFVDRSDEALYMAKQEGRNRICIERKG